MRNGSPEDSLDPLDGWDWLNRDWLANEVNHLLGLNEPDNSVEADLTTTQAVSLWPALLGTALRIVAPAPTTDVLDVGGTLTCGGTLVVASLGGAPAADDSFTLFEGGTIEGGFSAYSFPALDLGLVWNTDELEQGVLRVVRTVAADPPDLAVEPSANSMQFSWPADHTGWRLEMNREGLHDEEAWHTVSGASTTNLRSPYQTDPSPRRGTDIRSVQMLRDNARSGCPRHLGENWSCVRCWNSPERAWLRPTLPPWPPDTPAEWNPEQSIPNSGAGMTYANPFQLSGEGGKIYNFCRNQNFNPTVFTSADGGSSWSSPQRFIATGAGGTRPYGQGGSFYRTGGAPIKTYAALPINHDAGERGSVIYPYSNAAQADPNQWIPTGRSPGLGPPCHRSPERRNA